MRMVKSSVLTLALSFLVSFVGYGPVAAIETIPTVDPKMASPLLLTEFRTDQSTISYIQLYNNSNEVHYVADWELVAIYKEGGEYRYQLPEGYLAPGRYVVVSSPDVVTGEAVLALDGGETITSTDQFFLTEKKERYEPEPVPIATASEGVRHHRYTSTAGNYTATRTFAPLKDQQQPLRADMLEAIRESFPLAPVEILANPRNCAPGETDVACQDYVKFYNNTLETVDFSGVRLRIGYAGQTPTASNAIALSGVLQPGEYAVFATNASGTALNLTNSGAFVWLEYVHGVLLYKNTIVEYPDASSKKGQSWAVDETGEWRWATPQPGGENNFTLAAGELAACNAGYYRHPDTNRCRKIVVATTPKPCNADQERNPETGRCRKVQTASAQTPCKVGQYRHPETNRCRKLETASQSTPCKADQYRNPETGRCKKYATATAQKPCNANQYRNPETGRCKKVTTLTALKPCTAGQERNPETNRCRKIQKDMSDLGFSAEAVEASADTVASWWALGGVGSLAIGYAGWEWRSEMARWLRRIKEVFSSRG